MRNKYNINNWPRGLDFWLHMTCINAIDTVDIVLLCEWLNVEQNIKIFSIHWQNNLNNKTNLLIIGIFLRNIQNNNSHYMLILCRVFSSIWRFTLESEMRPPSFWRDYHWSLWSDKSAVLLSSSALILLSQKHEFRRTRPTNFLDCFYPLQKLTTFC